MKEQRPVLTDDQKYTVFIDSDASVASNYEDCVDISYDSGLISPGYHVGCHELQVTDAPVDDRRYQYAIMTSPGSVSDYND